MPDALGHYKLLNLIGTGRLGELYRARDLRAGRTVALRVVSDDIEGHPDRRERFLSDVRAAAALSHPNIAALYEVDEDQGHLFFVSEFVPGETLKVVIAGRALNPRHALDYGVQLADALAEGHAVSILYHELKPANVIVTPKGTAKLLDFGLARWAGLGQKADSTPGATGLGAGDEVYLSPELIASAPVDQRTDIFSLGVVLVEMLTGKPPVSGSTPGGGYTRSQLVSPAKPALPPELETIIAKLLAREPHGRYELTAMAAADLRSVLAGIDLGHAVGGTTSPDQSNPPRPVRRAPVPPPRRAHAPWARVGLVGLAIVALLWLAASGVGGRWFSPLIRAWHQVTGRG